MESLFRTLEFCVLDDWLEDEKEEEESSLLLLGCLRAIQSLCFNSLGQVEIMEGGSSTKDNDEEDGDNWLLMILDLLNSIYPSFHQQKTSSSNLSHLFLILTRICGVIHNLSSSPFSSHLLSPSLTIIIPLFIELASSDSKLDPVIEENEEEINIEKEQKDELIFYLIGILQNLSRNVALSKQILSWKKDDEEKEDCDGDCSLIQTILEMISNPTSSIDLQVLFKINFDLYIVY